MASMLVRLVGTAGAIRQLSVTDAQEPREVQGGVAAGRSWGAGIAQATRWGPANPSRRATGLHNVARRLERSRPRGPLPQVGPLPQDRAIRPPGQKRVLPHTSGGAKLRRTFSLFHAPNRQPAACRAFALHEQRQAVLMSLA